MIFIKSINELLNNEKIDINKLINSCFDTNRLNTYDTVIYYKNDIIVGFIGLEKNKYKNITILNQICVKHDYRNQGICSYMLNILKSSFKSTKYILYIDKFKDNTNILYNFYIKHFFEEINDELIQKLNIPYNKDVEYLMISK